MKGVCFWKYGIKLHLIEKLHVNGRDIGQQLIGSSGSKYMDEYASCYSYPKMIHILNEGLYDFVPILCKTSEPNKPIEKQTNISLSEGVHSHNNPTDRLALHPVKSVAASSQQVSLLSAHPECLYQGPKKGESAFEAKI